ncbi:hypothetical protein NL676_009588 [Syzygium grande]|nr:hypothetical protein NL676_009588 [Syzygium grande]
MQLALERAQPAHSNAYSLGPKCSNERKKVAWADCLQLYEHTLLRLNKSIVHNCTRDEVQTWLSTALTNLETCQAWFVKLGVSNNVLPLMSNNVSKLISNILALNYAPYTTRNYTKKFTTWVRPGDRKLLQSSSTVSKANIIMSQDGLGNYKKISEDVTAASKNSGTVRYIILHHLYQGWYL